jgi:S-adenosylmethionine-diacylgycerolhomoserine-N-methlytransferase
VHGVAPDRVLYSYCLSMVEEQALALGHARRSLAPSGQLVVVDFADLAALPATVRRPLTAWLRQFHVHPLDDGLLQGADALVHGPGRYYLLAHLGPQPQAEG